MNTCLAPCLTYACQTCPLTNNIVYQPFSQLYSIHGDLGSTVNNTNILPLVYALMSSRTEKSYFILFSLIKSQIPGWNPTSYKTDYEIAAMNAWAKELGTTKSNHPSKIREVQLSAVLPMLQATEIMKG